MSEQLFFAANERSNEILALKSQLRAFAGLFEKNPSEAEELVQATLAKGIEKQKSFNSEKGALKAWVFQILKNMHLSKVRSFNSSRRSDVDVNDAIDATTYVAPNQEWKADLQKVKDFLKLISPDQSEALLLMAQYGFSEEEIAVMQSVPVGTVKSRINKARTRLKEYFGTDLFKD